MRFTTRFWRSPEAPSKATARSYDPLMSFKADMNDRHGEPSVAGLLIDAISDCVPTIGTDKFTERFLHFVRLIGAGQVTAFAYESAKVNCLLSRNFLSEEKGGMLAAAYVDRWFVTTLCSNWRWQWERMTAP